MIITAKFISICLGLALTAFVVSTIVLAVQKTDLKNDLKEAREKLDMLEEALKSTTAVNIVSSTAPTTAVESTTAATTEATTVSPTVNYRLPDTMVPINYDLYLNPDISSGKFNGEVVISVRTSQATNEVVLHSLNLEIIHVYLLDVDSTLTVKGHSLEALREFLIIELSESVAANKEFRVGIIFEGVMDGPIVGLYSSSYTKNDGSKKVIATSKFEPTYARRAYPCFDEPAMKATFDVTLVHPNDGSYHALSNMDIVSQEVEDSYTEVFFSKSVPMSTYLSCFIVSDFAYKSVQVDTKGIGDAFTLRVYATPHQLDKVDFALDVGKTVIEYYIDYFQIAYPLPKLDMAAIPDFVSGAMEHWGLVTYRETSLLYEEGVSSSVNKQRVATVIAHEFAHMWFGNLVTMNWWNDLWLNEGFATFIEYMGTNAAFPEWKMPDQFITGTLHSVLTLDATLGAHPIIQTVSNPDQITEIFDTITYSKGASIIRMLNDFLGSDNFRTAVTNYLNAYKYQNAVTANFVEEINKLNLGIDVVSIMDTWTVQMGLPVVLVEKLSDLQYKLTQMRFLSNPDDYSNTYDDSPYNYAWSIPITYKTSASSEVQRAWFYYNQDEITITLDSAVDWIKFNYDQVGYYRVNYPVDMWQTLAEKLVDDPSVFSIGDRACLLNDAFSLSDATQLDYAISLDMMRYLSKENDYVPWSVAASKLTSLKRKLMFTDSFVNFNTFARDLIRPIYNTVSWTVGTDHLQNRLRVTILNAACSLGLSDCLEEASKRFVAWLADPVNSIPHPDVRETVYYYGTLASGNEVTWEQMWNLYLTESDASEKTKLMSGLAAVQVPWILKRFIDLAWNENNVRSQDYFTCLSNIAANPIGEPLVWEYVRDNWEKIVERFTLNERYLGSMIPSITAYFYTETKLEEMQNFFTKYPEAGAGTAARTRALETVKNNIVWLANNSENVGNWLAAQTVSTRSKKLKKY